MDIPLLKLYSLERSSLFTGPVSTVLNEEEDYGVGGCLVREPSFIHGSGDFGEDTV